MLIGLKIMLRTLVLPPGGLLLLIAIGMLLVWRRRAIGYILMIAGLSFLWLLSTPPVAGVLTRLAEHYPALDPRNPADRLRESRAQAIVILGAPSNRSAPEYGGGQAVELDLMDRVCYGAYLAKGTSLPVLVTSTSDNATAMAESLRRDFGVPTRWIESLARDTFENAQNSAEILLPRGIRTILLVTSSTHMLRSVHEFKAAGFTVIPAPVRASPPLPEHLDLPLDPTVYLIPDPDSLRLSQRAIYELLGEPVRELLAGLHLRQQTGGPGTPATNRAAADGAPAADRSGADASTPEPHGR